MCDNMSTTLSACMCVCKCTQSVVYINKKNPQGIQYVIQQENNTITTFLFGFLSPSHTTLFIFAFECFDSNIVDFDKVRLIAKLLLCQIPESVLISRNLPKLPPWLIWWRSRDSIWMIVIGKMRRTMIA